MKDILPTGNSSLPPPFLLKIDNDGSLKIPQLEATKENDRFSDLFIRNSIGLKPFTTNGFSVLYDYYCLSIHDQITGTITFFHFYLHFWANNKINLILGRTCEMCGPYFASKKQKKIHTKALHGVTHYKIKVKANKVISRRGNEVLSKLKNMFKIEWFEAEDVEFNSKNKIIDPGETIFP